MRQTLLAAALVLSMALPLPAEGQGAPRFLDAGDVAAEVRRFVAAQLGTGPDRAEVRSVQLQGQRVLLPPGRVSLEAELPPQGRLLGRTPLMVVVRNEAGAEVRRLWVTAEIAVYAAVPVARVPLGANQVVDASFFEMRRKDLASLPPDALTRMEDLEGARLRRALAPGEAVRAAEVELPYLVRQGSLVRIVARRGGLMMTAVGKALDSGRKGEAIRILNVDSNKMVQGRVVEKAAVEVLF